MQLTEAQKQKFLEYVEKKRLMLESKSSNNGKNKSAQGDKIEYALDLSDLFKNMVQDLVKKTGRTDSIQQFGDYIFVNAMQNMENSLSDEDKTLTAKDSDQDSKLSILIDLLGNTKYNNHFITGLALGYAKLAYRLEVEPEVAYVGVVETLSTITE